MAISGKHHICFPFSRGNIICQTSRQSSSLCQVISDEADLLYEATHRAQSALIGAAEDAGAELNSLLVAVHPAVDSESPWVPSDLHVGQKKEVPKMGCPGKWKHGLKPAVFLVI